MALPMWKWRQQRKPSPEVKREETLKRRRLALLPLQWIWRVSNAGYA